jgi:hypothetical protein
VRASTIIIEADDLALVIDAPCLGIRAARNVNGLVSAATVQKPVRASTIIIEADDLTLVVDAVRFARNAAGWTAYVV